MALLLNLHDLCVLSAMLSSKIYMFWIRNGSDFLLNNQNTATDLQIGHPGSLFSLKTWSPMYGFTDDQLPVDSGSITSDE